MRKGSYSNKLKEPKVLGRKSQERISGAKESKNQQPNDEINFQYF